MTSHSDQLREFIQQIQHRASLEQYEEAHQLAVATLEALGQSVSGGQAQQLAQWVPPELGEELTGHTGHASAFDKSNFLDKIGGKIFTVDIERVEQYVRVTLQTVRSYAPTEEFDNTIAQLPDELAALFDHA